eukprot:5471478-Prymnesium_polylepis.1
MSSGSTIIIGSLISNSRASKNAGAIQMNGGVVTVSNSSIQRSSAAVGGVISSVRGVATVDGGSLIIHAFAGEDGGVVDIGGGEVVFTGGSMIANSTADFAGGFAACAGGRVLVTNRTLIANCTATNWLGGAVRLYQGIVQLANESAIINTSALQSGGAFFITGGSLSLSNSRVSNAAASNEGGFAKVEGGEVLLTYAIIEYSTTLARN